MNRISMLKQTKLEMKRWIDQVEVHNMDEIKEKLEHYFQMISLLGALPDAPEVKKKEKKVTIAGISEGAVSIEEQDCTPTEEKEIEQKDVSKTGYVFERKLRGGILPDINAFIPEGIVRKLQLENGDIVEARKMEDAPDDGRNRYHYTLVERGEGLEAKDRMQLDYCVVEKEAGSLIVHESRLSGESVRYNGVAFSIVLNEGDVRHFSIREGDIIDIAYKKGMPSDHRVLWKHDDIEMPEVKISEPLQKKKKPSEPSSEMVEETFQPDALLGMTVLVVGNEGARTSYQEQIEKRGGEFLWVDAKEKVDKFQPLVKKSSFVVFLLGVSGHTGMKKIKQLCKDYDVPFEATFNQGITSVVRLTEELAEKIRIEKKESHMAL